MRLVALALSAALLLAALCSAFVQSPAYSHTMGVKYVLLSGAAYCSSSSISSWNCGACKQAGALTSITVATNSAYNAQGFVGYSSSSNEIIVSFRGTQPLSLTNWINDIDAIKASGFVGGCSSCQLHAGFMNTYKSIQGTIVNAVKSLRSQHASAIISVTGHSLGGAMATVCAADLQYNVGLPVTRLVTLGSPRVGNAAFYSYMAGKSAGITSYRMTHAADPVPHLPFASWDFHHVPFEVYYSGSSTSFKVCSSSGEDSSCADGQLLPLNVLDHITYLNMLVSGMCTASGMAEARHNATMLLGADTEAAAMLRAPEGELIDGPHEEYVWPAQPYIVTEARRLQLADL